MSRNKFTPLIGLDSILKKIVTNNSNILLSCSEKAGEFLFGSKNFTIVPNPIETNRFLRVSSIKVQQLKSDLGISEEIFVIGHVGRFSAEKNHAFILKIAKKLTKLQVNFKVIFVGDGELKLSVKDEAINLGIQDKIIFAGKRTNVEEFYNLFDVLLFPSLHEGFGNVAVEGQVSGKKVIASTGVSEEVDLGLGLIKFIDVRKFDAWVKEILISMDSNITVSEIDIKDALYNRGFGIDGVVRKYTDIYSGQEKFN
ncbi:MAG TPA: glycosyltransferase family 1 protein [Gallicola sp.]|nr:glycosyltransferase family 1 protein [Gallicola sp.]